MNLIDKAKQLPSTPGVYLMKDSHGSIIYVGKSKNLKSRVSSYFQHSSQHSNKVIKLVHHLKDFDIIHTDTEFEAFMLECKLIKDIQPLYNRMMKNPRSYSYISVKRDQSYRRIEFVHEMEEGDRHLYFGPFSSIGTTEKAIQGLKEMFKLDCNQSTTKNSPCLNYSLGLCMGMCFDPSALKQYHHMIDRIIGLLEGTDSSLLEEMEQRMIQASSQFDFEEAAKVRDRIEWVQSLLKKEQVIRFIEEDQNIVMMEYIGDNRVKMFLIRRNQILFSKVYGLDHTNLEKLVQQIKSEILSYFSQPKQSMKKIKKDEIDEAAIIYRYMNSHDRECIIIPDQWLNSKRMNKMEQAVLRLVSSLTASV
ncbi:UvrB/UvrC motif-containing protein [Niallia sp. Krafla_26]|uniref:UvrB/UvrC motif-containing protein n=1 Tax=Niallia sp. Krafla_26 TaxID=3064703 RepID=UPI003D170E47